MNPTTLRMGYRGAKAAWHKFQELKNKAATEAYDGLLEAANSAQDLSGDASGKLSTVLEQSKKRLERPRLRPATPPRSWKSAVRRPGRT